MKKINTALTATLTALAAAFLIQVPAHAFTNTNLLISDFGTSAPTGTTISSSSTSNSTSANTTTAPGSRGITQSYQITSSQTGGTGGHAELLNIYVLANVTQNSSVGTWTLRIGSLSGTGSTATTSDITTITTNEAGSIATIGNAHYIKFALGNANYLLQDVGTYYFNIQSSSTIRSISVNSNDTNVTGQRAGDLSSNNSGATFTRGTGSLTFFIDTVAVPEPSQWALVPVLGVIGFLAFRRFRGASVA